MCTHTRDTGPRQSLRNSAFRTGAVAGAGDVHHRRDKMIAQRAIIHSSLAVLRQQ